MRTWPLNERVGVDRFGARAKASAAKVVPDGRCLVFALARQTERPFHGRTGEQREGVGAKGIRPGGRVFFAVLVHLECFDQWWIKDEILER